MIRTYRNLPAIPTGYPLDEVWSVVVPVARTNEVLNPSAETNTTSYTAGAGTLTRSTEQQYHGAYSFKYVPSAAVTDGFFYGTIATTSGQIRAIHCKFRGVAGVPYALTLATTGGVDLVTKPFVATGRWQWIILYHTETSSTTRRIYFRKNNSSSVGAFYVDGVNSEVIQAGELASTHIDGDQLGLVPNQSPPAYVWNGTPHASTSTRSAQTRAGGMVIPFKKYGFILTAMIGLGMAGVQNVSTDYARIDGAYDDYTRKPSRQFTLTGRFQGRTYGELRRNRSGLAQLFDRDLTGQDQRLTLLHHVEDGYGRIVSSSVRTLAKYESGFSGNTDNMHAENVPITFTQYLPAILADGESGGALDVQDSVSNSNAILQRSPAGVWSAMGTGMSPGAALVLALAQGLDGKIYAGGDFTDAGGSGADYIAQWNGSAWSVLNSATAINGLVWALAVGPDGAIYVGGSFTNAGGVAAADGIAKWDGSAWTALGTGATGGTGTVYALVFGADGTLYAGGDFTAMGGVGSTNNIAKWNGTAWSALGTGAAGGSAGVFALAAFGNTIYAGGNFDNMGGVAAADDIAKWNGSSWSALGTSGTNADIRSIAVGANGVLYIGGDFTTINGLSITALAQWNGVSFTSLGVLNNAVYEVVLDRNGVLHIGGTFTTINGIAYPNSFAKLSGTFFSPEDVKLAGSVVVIVETILATPDGSLYVGHSKNGTATTPGVVTITNPGTARSYPTIIMKGPTTGSARIYQITNYVTGRALYLTYTIIAGETAELVLTPDSLSFTSDFQGNVMGTILPGSNEADFFLQPGANTISFFSNDTSVTATLYYRPAYVSMDDVP